MKSNADLLDEANERTKNVAGGSYLEEVVHDTGTSQIRLFEAFLETGVGRFMILCLDSLAALLRKFG